MIMEGWTNKLALRTDGPTARVDSQGCCVGGRYRRGGGRLPGQEIH